MLICIDTRVTASDEMGGVARYTRTLLRCLAEVDAHNDYVLIYPGYRSRRPPRPGPNFGCVCVPVRPYTLAEQHYIPQVLRGIRPDVFHCPTFAAPAWAPCPMVMTIYDMIHLLFGKVYRLRHRLYYHWVVRQAARRSARVLTLSECSKRDIVSRLGVPPEKVEVHPGWVSRQFVGVPTDEAAARLRMQFGITGPFLLGLVTHRPHKNALGLLEAYARLRRQHGVLLPLLVVGVRLPDLQRLTGTLSAEPGVRCLGTVSDYDLRCLYSQTSLFWFPSQYEGFGLPVLEAMTCGAPVASSQAACLTEVCGDAAAPLDAHDPDQMAATVARVLADKDRLADLRQRGLRRARQFDGRRIARDIVRCYESVAAEAGRR